MDNAIDIKIDVTTVEFLLVQNRHQTHDVATWKVVTCKSALNWENDFGKVFNTFSTEP